MLSKTIAAANSIKELKRVGASVPRDTYLSFTDNMMENMLNSNSSVGGIDAEEKRTRGRVYAQKSKQKLTDMFTMAYGWMKHLDFQFVEELDPVCTVCPMLVLDPRIQKLMCSVGLSASKNIYDLNPERLLSFLRKDPNFPRYFTADMVFKLIQKPQIGLFPDRIYHTLVALGLDTTIAASAVANLISKGHEYLMMTQGSVVSANDQIIGMLNLSRKNYERLVDCPLIQNDIVRGVIHSLAVSVLIHNYMRTSKFHKVRVRFTDEGLSKLMSAFTGTRKKYVPLKYLGLYTPSKRDIIQ
jgi:hypothetical protein